MNLALFDFDGTITTREMLPDFLHYSIPKRRLQIGKLALAPLIAGYKIGLVSGSLLRATIVWLGYARASVDDYARKGQSFATEMLPGVLRPEVMERIRWHQTSISRLLLRKSTGAHSRVRHQRLQLRARGHSVLSLPIKPGSVTSPA